LSCKGGAGHVGVRAGGSTEYENSGGKLSSD